MFPCLQREHLLTLHLMVTDQGKCFRKSLTNCSRITFLTYSQWHRYRIIMIWFSSSKSSVTKICTQCLTIFGMESTTLGEAILIVESANYCKLLQRFYEFMKALYSILQAGVWTRRVYLKFWIIYVKIFTDAWFCGFFAETCSNFRWNPHFTFIYYMKVWNTPTSNCDVL